MAINEYSSKDQHYYNVWKKNPNDENLNKLLTQVSPLIQHHVSKLSTNNIPRSAMEAHATNLVIDSLPKYNPNKTQLNTYLTWQLKQLNRYVYKHQNIGKIPESRIVNIGNLKRAKADWETMYGTQPSNADMADKLKMPLKEVELLERELRKDLSADFNKQDMFKTTTGDIDAVYTIWADAKPVDKKILEHLYGLNGAEILSLKEISSKLNITPVRLSQIKNKLGQQVLRYKLETMQRY